MITSNYRESAREALFVLISVIKSFALEMKSGEKLLGPEIPIKDCFCFVDFTCPVFMGCKRKRGIRSYGGGMGGL